MRDEYLQALREEIIARVPAEILATQDIEVIATELSAGRTRMSAREIGNGLVLETLGLEIGNTVLDIVQSEPALRHVRPLLEQGRLVAGSTLVQVWLGGLVQAGVLTSTQADAVVALGYEPAPVSEFDVRCACIGDTGNWVI